MPVTRVTWNEANRYCAWRYGDGRLPTEQEWEAAARGQTALRYPWGAEWVGGRANTVSSGASAPVAVGSFPEGASGGGAHDLIGNVWEWTSSPMAAYPGGAVPPGSGGNYVIRGGAYNTPDSIAEATRRGYLPATTADRRDIAATGFRCALPLTE